MRRLTALLGAHSDSIEFICAIQKTLMYVCMYQSLTVTSHAVIFNCTTTSGQRILMKGRIACHAVIENSIIPFAVCRY